MNVYPELPPAPAPTLFAVANLTASPGSTLASAAIILQVIAHASVAGFPTTPVAWVMWIGTVATGIAAAFAR